MEWVNGVKYSRWWLFDQSQSLCECRKGACPECCGCSGRELASEALGVLRLWDVQHTKPYVLVLCVISCYMLSSLGEIQALVTQVAVGANM
jgi:hypothetical protein